MRSLSTAGFAALILFGCVKSSPTPVYKVGQFEFTAQDIEQRKKVLLYYFPHESSPNVKKELAQHFTKIQALLDNGFPDLRERVISEDKRVDSTTMDPTGLAKIKRIFDNDTEAYRRLFLMPLLAPKLITELALRHPEVQANSRRKIEAFLIAAEKNPAQFAVLAKKEKLARRVIRVSETTGVHYEAAVIEEDRDVASAISPDVSPLLTERWQSENRKAEVNEAEKWVREMAVSLKPGAVSPRIVDKGETWVAIRFLGTDKKTKEVIFEGAEVPKDPIGGWIEKETAKVKIVDG